jgi:hypothetical protein
MERFLLSKSSGGDMLKVIPTPKGFVSTAGRDADSDNYEPVAEGLTTEKLIHAAKSAGDEFRAFHT